MEYAEPFRALVGALEKLPGIGHKTALRLALHVMKAPRAEVEELAAALVEVRDKIRACSRCHVMTEDDPCHYCRDASRDQSTLLVIEDAGNVFQMERSHYRGLYHVLGGVLSPLKGVGPDALNFASLARRLEDGTVQEVIVATNPTSEGEATAHYVLRMLKPHAVRVSRIAFGLPVGADLEYADEVTLGKALEGRREM